MQVCKISHKESTYLLHRISAFHLSDSLFPIHTAMKQDSTKIRNLLALKMYLIAKNS